MMRRFIKIGFLVYIIIAAVICGVSYRNHQIKVEAGNDTAIEGFLHCLQGLPQGTVVDFSPSTTSNGWTYFFVEDQKSIYRLGAGNSIPEFVCRDCDGAVQCMDDFILFQRNLRELDSIIIRRNLTTGKEERVSNSIAYSNLDHSFVVLGEFLLTQFSWDTATVKKLSAAASRGEPVEILGEPVHEFIWANGTCLVYSVPSKEFTVELKQWDFVSTPRSMNIPDGYSYWNHYGDRLFCKNKETGDIQEYSFVSDQWSKVGTGSVGSFSELYVAPDGVLYENRSRQIWDLSDNQEVWSCSGQETGCINILYIDDDILCYTYEEYHSDYTNCGCLDANYLHYYIRTKVISRRDGEVLWYSDGDCFNLGS